MTEQRHPHLDLNAAGLFYTTGECMACGAPEDEAPDLFAPLEGENFDTYFVRQPSTPEEVERACRAAHACCVNAVRYGGTDPAIILRLGNRPQYCDHLLPGGPVRLPNENEQQWALVQPKPRWPWWAFWKR
jgi:ferredoxin